MSSDSNLIRFEAYHKPLLEKGKYEIKAALKVAHDGESHTESFPTIAQSFYVTGPRFVLNPADIYTVFPPKDSNGEHDNVLPHIIFNRSTLPWERSPGTPNGSNPIPWLALLVVHQDELDSGKVRTITPSYDDALSMTELTKEPGEDNYKSNTPTVVVAHKEWFKQVFSNYNDLYWQTHVRCGHTHDQKPFERPTLVANRMPKPGGKTTVYLVSLEKRFQTDGNLTQVNGHGLSSDENALVSLYHWSFSVPDVSDFKITQSALDKHPIPGVSIPVGVDPDALIRGHEALFAKWETPLTASQKNAVAKTFHRPRETFKGLCDHLNRASFRFSIPPSESPSKGEDQLSIGNVPLPHSLRNGKKMVSWFRPPFLPSRPVNKDENIQLPVQNADELLRHDATNGMLDTTYAAAWELGRAMTLNRPKLAAQLIEWKRRHAQKVRHAEQVLTYSHLPFQDRDFQIGGSDDLNAAITEYFTALELFRGVPFHYLVPDESYLPKESIRFFAVDPLWTEALLDGAFALGRTTDFDKSREQSDRQQLPSAPARKRISGILIRSDVVSGWPGLIADAFTHSPLQGSTLAHKVIISKDSSEIATIVEKLNAYNMPSQLPSDVTSLEHFSIRAETDDQWQVIDRSSSVDYRLFFKIKKEGSALVGYRNYQLKVIRMDRLSPNVLLCLYDGLHDQVDLHLPPEELHFGFVRPWSDEAKYYKELKDADSGIEFSPTEKQDIVWNSSTGINDDERLTGLVNMTELASQMKTKMNLDDDHFHAGHFGMEMIEGIPKIRFLAT